MIMNTKMKLGFLILLATVIANAAPVQDDLVIAAVVDDTDNRETRSADSTGRPSIPWHLDRIDQQKPQLNGKYNPFANATGTGVDIYILAEGLEYDNEEFGGRAFHGNFKPETGCAAEYGTELASLVAGKDYGVAKNANIYSINLLTCRLFSNVANLVRAVQHVIKRVKTTGRRSVIAVPLLGLRSDILNDVVEEAVKENIVVVTAAGNTLQNACRYSPGSSPHVINVGATKLENGEDRLYDMFFSGTNFGPCVSLYAPGEYISSINKQRGSGTAQACAIVTGAAALVLEKYPHYTPAEVKQHLINSATDGVINMESLRFIEGDRGTNKLLYVGNYVDDDESSGNDFDYASGDSNIIQPLM